MRYALMCHNISCMHKFESLPCLLLPEAVDAQPLLQEGGSPGGLLGTELAEALRFLAIGAIHK